MSDKLGVASGARMPRIFMDLENQRNLTFSANRWISLPSWHLRLYQAYSTSLVVELMEMVEKWLQKPYYTFEILYSLYLQRQYYRFDTMCVHRYFKGSGLFSDLILISTNFQQELARNGWKIEGNNFCDRCMNEWTEIDK